MVCGTDELQACGKTDLSFPGLSSLCFMVLAGLNLPHWGVFPRILLLAQLQCCSQLLSGYTVLLSFGEAASMVRAGTAQDGDSVVPFTMWVFALPSTMLLQKQANISL